MKSIFKPLVLTAVLATSALWAQAQTPPRHGTDAGPRHGPARPHGSGQDAGTHGGAPGDLKAKLKLNAAQSGAWNDYLAAMQPPANGMMGKSRDERRKMHEEMQSLTTPQRLDRMAAMKAERDAQMHRRQQATRNFYDTLTPQQQKVFDANAMMGGKRMANLVAWAATATADHQAALRARGAGCARAGVRPAFSSIRRWPATFVRHRRRRPARP